MSSLPPDDVMDDGCYSNGVWVQGLMAPWHPTDDVQIQESLTAAGLHPSDLLLELGCGDGVICRAAASHFGCRAVGVELDPIMVKVALEHVRDLCPSSRKLVHIVQGDIMDATALRTEDPPTCVTMSIMPDFYEKLDPILEQFVSRGAKLIVYMWELKGARWKNRLVQEGDRWWLYHSPASC